MIFHNLLGYRQYGGDVQVMSKQLSGNFAITFRQSSQNKA
jgi:hypothetical protein